MLNEHEYRHTTWETYIGGQFVSKHAEHLIQNLSLSCLRKSSVSDKVEDDADPSDLDVELPRVALNPGRILNVFNEYK